MQLFIIIVIAFLIWCIADIIKDTKVTKKNLIGVFKGEDKEEIYFKKNGKCDIYRSWNEEIIQNLCYTVTGSYVSILGYVKDKTSTKIDAKFIYNNHTLLYRKTDWCELYNDEYHQIKDSQSRLLKLYQKNKGMISIGEKKNKKIEDNGQNDFFLVVFGVMIIIIIFELIFNNINKEEKEYDKGCYPAKPHYVCTIQEKNGNIYRECRCRGY